MRDTRPLLVAVVLIVVLLDHLVEDRFLDVILDVLADDLEGLLAVNLCADALEMLVEGHGR